MRFRVQRIQELKDADDVVFVILQRHNEHGSGPVPGGSVIGSRPGEIKELRFVNVRDVHNLPRQCHIGRDIAIIGIAVSFQWNGRKLDGDAAGSAPPRFKGVVLENCKSQNLRRLIDDI